MNRLIEPLEDRQMFSVTLMPALTHDLHGAAIHAAATQTEALHFQGPAVNATDGKVAAQLQLVVTKLAGQYQAQFTVSAPSGHGSPVHFVVPVDSTGHFVYSTANAHVEGQISSDHTSITGTFAQTRADGSSSGTFTLTRSDLHTNTGGNTTAPSAPSTVPPASTMLFKGAHYTGSVNSSTGVQTSLVMDLVKTIDGSFFGIMTHTNSDGTIDTVAVKFDAHGHFVRNGDDHGESLKLEGQMSSDGKTLKGSYLSSHGSAKAEVGTFTLVRA